MSPTSFLDGTKGKHIYRADGSKDELHGFDSILSGEDVCAGLTLDLRRLRIL